MRDATISGKLLFMRYRASHELFDFLKIKSCCFSR